MKTISKSSAKVCAHVLKLPTRKLATDRSKAMLVFIFLEYVFHVVFCIRLSGIKR